MLPAQYVRAYVRRNKTDAADALALLEAAKASDIRPVKVKSVEQQALQALHRRRSLWMTTRTSRINALRGFCREMGLHVPVGARPGLDVIARAIVDDRNDLPDLLRPVLQSLLEEIRSLEARIAQLEREWLALGCRPNAGCQLLMTIPGVGLLTATGIAAATAGSVAHFANARHFASWFGLTPRESSSGERRSLGGISKRGDRYLRMLLTHGARSVLRAAVAARTKGTDQTGIRLWATKVQQRSNYNRAVWALANKLARICYGVLRNHTPFGQSPQRLANQAHRHSFALAAH